MAGFVSALSRGTANQTQASPETVGINGQQVAVKDFNNTDPSQPWMAPTFEGAYSAGHKMENGGMGDLSLGRGAQGLGWYRTDPRVQQQNAQKYFTQQFRQNIPGMEGDLYNQLNQGVSQEMNQGIQNTKQANSRRGLLYGGVNAGGEGAVRANAAGELARGRTSINSGLLDAANQMEGNQIKTGLDIQRNKQTIADSIYQRAMAEASGTGAMVGDVLGAAGAVAGAYFGGGAGATAGYAGGKAAGSAIAGGR